MSHLYNLDANDADLDIAAMTLGIIVVDNAKVKRNEPDQLDKWWGITNPYDGPGVWVWVEYKTEAGSLSPGQARKIAEMTEAGLPVEVVRSTDDVIDVFKKYRDEMWGAELTKAQLRNATRER